MTIFVTARLAIKTTKKRKRKKKKPKGNEK